MDKLLSTVLLLVLLFDYPNLLLFSIFASPLIGLTYISLFFMTILSIYNIYGLTGLFILLLSQVSFVTSIYMYLTNSSFNDLFSLPNMCNSYLMLNYNRIGITQDKINYLHNIYNTISLKYDILCDVIYKYLCYFRNRTENIVYFQYLYSSYDKCMNIKQYINHFRNLFNMKSSVTTSNIIPTATMLIDAELNQDSCDTDDDILDTDEPTIQEIKPIRKLANTDQFATLLENNNINFNNMNFNNIDFMSMNQQMERQLSNLRPEQKQQLDKMAMDMMDGLFGNFNKKTS